MTPTIKLPDITESAMLVHLSVSVWSGQAIDLKVSEEVAKKHNTSSDVGKYRKILVSKDAIRAVQNAAGHIRTTFHDWTLPWDSDGVRILNAEAYFDFTQAVAKARSEFDQKVDEFVASYADLIKQAKKMLNGLFNQSDYPSEDDIRRKFGMSLQVMPMPAADDFRVALSKSEADNVRKNIQKHVQETLKNAMEDAWHRLYEEVAHIADIMKTDKTIRDAALTNLISVCSVLSKINITKDPDLERMRADVERDLCKMDPEMLRTSDKLRTIASKKADDLLAKMSSYVGDVK